MTTTEKNIAIAEMLEWTKTGHKHPFTPSLGELYRHKNYSGDYWGEKFRYHSDANWQFEAINYLLQNDISYNLVLFRKNVSVSIQKCYSDDEGVYIKREDGNFTETIFEALYQFSQYLKQIK